MTEENRQLNLEGEWKLSQFSLHFVKDGRFPAGLATNLANLQQQREIADYERDLQIDSQQAESAREQALEIKNQIESWLRQGNWLR